MTGLEVINNWLRDAESSLLSKYNSMGLKASGQWAKDLESKSEAINEGYHIEILGSRYTEQLVNGRSRNKNQDKVKGFAWYSSRSTGWAYEWCKNKGIDTRFAYPIALSVGENGIKVPNMYNSGDLISSTINDKSIKKLIKDIGFVVLDNFSQGLKKELK